VLAVVKIEDNIIDVEHVINRRRWRTGRGAGCRQRSCFVISPSETKAEAPRFIHRNGNYSLLSLSIGRFWDLVPHTSTTPVLPTENQNGLKKKYLPNRRDTSALLLE
jgi:hypothetical protein